MMRAILLLVLLPLAADPAAALPDLSAAELRKLDPLLAVAVPAAAEAGATAAAPPVLGPMAIAAGARIEGEVPVINLLIEVRNGDTRGLAELGITPDAVIGDVAAARDVPLALIAGLARRPEVLSIQAAARLFPMNDVSVPETGAPGVWAPPFNATGSNVIVGIIDTGIDLNHPDFMNPDGITTRIKWLLDLSQSGGGPAGGTLFSENDINAGAVARDRVGHGTHVAGTAAGGGWADPLFRGVAYEADLIIVNASRSGDGSFSENDIVSSLGFIDAQAATLGKPYVANLSLGGHAGAHDGSGLMERTIDFLVGAGKAGKAIVIAAGNERGTVRHATAEVEQGDLPAGINIRFNIPDYDPMPSPLNDFVVVNFWYEVSSNFTFTVLTPHGFTVGPFAPGESNGDTGTITNDGLVGAQNAIGGSNPQNGDHEASFIVIDYPMPLVEGTWTIRISGDTGPVDGYIAVSSLTKAGAPVTTPFLSPYGTPNGFVAEPGTARNAITVGAYATKNEWDDTDGNHHGPFGWTIGAAASFSNAGPTRDGRYKPELAAPGAVIASCFSVDAPPGSAASVYTSPFPQFENFFIVDNPAGDYYAIQQGTSQATPHVTGATALLFQLHSDWDILDVKRALTTSARGDGFTGPLPNDLFGHGKLDVLEAATGAEADTLPPGDVNGNNTTDLADALLALDFVVGAQSPSGEERRRADMNADGLLQIGDVVLIVREFTGPLVDPVGPPSEAAGADIWKLPVSLAASQTVVGAEVVIAFDPVRFEPVPEAVAATRDGVLAFAASRAAGGGKAASLHIVTLALDGRDLAEPGPLLLASFRDRMAFPGPGGTLDPDGASDPNGASDPGLRVVRSRLVGPGAEPVDGKTLLGRLERVAPASFKLWPVAPNPSAAEPGRIAFDLPGPGRRQVTVEIYDVTGRLAARLVDGIRDPGRHVIAWDGLRPDGRRLPAGVYWVRVAAGSDIAAERLTLVR